MAKRVVFIRHGQGFHNLHRNWALRDPLLTELGEQQAASLREDAVVRRVLSSYPDRRQIAIAVSPLRRTVQTAWFGLKDVEPKFENDRWHLNADIVETGDVACDTGDTALGRELLVELGRADLVAQYDNLPDGWTVKNSGYFNDDVTAIRKRFAKFASWCLAREEPVIIAVAHYSLIFTCLHVQLENCEVVEFDLTPSGEWEYAEDRSPAELA